MRRSIGRYPLILHDLEFGRMKWRNPQQRLSLSALPFSHLVESVCLSEMRDARPGDRKTPRLAAQQAGQELLRDLAVDCLPAKGRDELGRATPVAGAGRRERGTQRTGEIRADESRIELARE
jgi:hypothetical protein